MGKAHTRGEVVKASPSFCIDHPAQIFATPTRLLPGMKHYFLHVFILVLLPVAADQNGMVYERIGPVFQKDSVVGFAGIGVFDTIWEDNKCPSYKEEGHSYMYYDTSIIIDSDDLVGYRYDQTPVYRPRLQPVDRILIKEVKKKYVCTVRRREIVPFDKNFWQWIKSR